MDRIKAAWDRDTAAADARFAAAFRYPLCNEQVPPGHPCGLLAHEFRSEDFKAEFIRSRCANPPQDAPESYCFDRYYADFIAAVEDRYAVAPEDVCGDGSCNSLVLLELQVLKASNADALRTFGEESAALNVKYKAKSDAVLEQFRSEVAAINADTTQRLDRAERTRSALLAASTSMQAVSQSLAYQPPPRTGSVVTAPTTAATAPTGCSSDFECGFGNLCVKDSGAFNGVCARAVNQYGTPTHQAPRSDSLRPGVGQCSFDTECSVGFRCVKTAGGLRGNCMK